MVGSRHDHVGHPPATGDRYGLRREDEGPVATGGLTSFQLDRDALERWANTNCRMQSHGHPLIGSFAPNRDTVDLAAAPTANRGRRTRLKWKAIYRRCRPRLRQRTR